MDPFRSPRVTPRTTDRLDNLGHRWGGGGGSRQADIIVDSSDSDIGLVVMSQLAPEAHEDMPRRDRSAEQGSPR